MATIENIDLNVIFISDVSDYTYFSGHWFIFKSIRSILAGWKKINSNHSNMTNYNNWHTLEIIEDRKKCALFEDHRLLKSGFSDNISYTGFLFNCNISFETI